MDFLIIKGGVTEVDTVVCYFVSDERNLYF